MQAGSPMPARRDRGRGTPPAIGVSSREGDTGRGWKDPGGPQSLGTVGLAEAPLRLVFIAVLRSAEMMAARFLPP